MSDYIIGGVLEYVTAVLGVQFDEVAAMAPAQVVLLLLGAVVVLFELHTENGYNVFENAAYYVISHFYFSPRKCKFNHQSNQIHGKHNNRAICQNLKHIGGVYDCSVNLGQCSINTRYRSVKSIESALQLFKLCGIIRKRFAAHLQSSPGL